MRYQAVNTYTTIRSGGEILTHARDIGTSMRREDTSRKQAREAAAARKAEEKAERMRGRDRLNMLKKQEILDKIAQIKKVAGAAEGFDLTELDLETEYDPETHDSKMQRVFNDLFYQSTVCHPTCQLLFCT
jgi:protein KRI1